MPIIPIENLGRAGFNVDEEPHNLAPEYWTDGANIRFREGKAEKIQGHVAWGGTPTIAPHWLLAWKTLIANYWFYAGTVSVYRTNGTAHLNVTRYTTTPGDADYDAGTRPIWSGGILHGVPIINNNNLTDPPQQWDGANTRFKDLNNFPANTYAKVIRMYKNFVIALDVTKGSDRYPYMVKWSSVADPGSVPASWDETDATVLTGENTLAQTNGFVVDCLPLGDNNMIYKQDAIWGMQFIGGIDVFRFYEISQTIGTLGPGCMVEFYRKHLLVGQNDIVLFDGVTPVSIIDKRMRTWFYENLHEDYTDYTVVSLNPRRQEVWICFVESGSVSNYLTKALIWNWSTNVWSVRDLPTIAHMAFGNVAAGDNSFDGSSGTFDSDSGAFTTSGLNPAQQEILFAKPYTTSEIFQGDSGYTDDGTNFSSRLERTGLAIAGRDRQGNPKVDSSKRKFLRSIYPKLSAPTAVELSISAGSQEVPGGPVTWEGPYTFNSGTDVKVDFSVNGPYIAYKFEETGSLPWALTGLELDIDIISRL